MAALLAAGAMAAACGNDSSPKAQPTAAPPSQPGSSAPTPSASPSADDFFESFDNNTNDWPERSDSDGTRLEVTGGQYRITLPAGSIRYIRPAALAQRDDVKQNVSITARVRALDGTASRWAWPAA